MKLGFLISGLLFCVAGLFASASGDDIWSVYICVGMMLTVIANTIA